MKMPRRIGAAGWKSLPPLFLTLVLAGCMGFGGGKTFNAAAGPAAPVEEPIDIRKYLGPDYCPDIRIREGTETARAFERGFQDDNSRILWQASIGETARECLYDGQGNLLLRIGVSGRVLAGPKGSPGTVSLPLRIAVVQFREALLSSQIYSVPVAVPPQGSALFSEVRELNLPSPGRHRNYLIYVGFDQTGKAFEGIVGN